MYDVWHKPTNKMQCGCSIDDCAVWKYSHGHYEIIGCKNHQWEIEKQLA